MSNFYKDFILSDNRFASTQAINDIGLLEPVTRLAVQNIISEAKQMGMALMVFETYRSKQRQESLFNEGRSKLRTVGVHHYGLACDIVKSVNGKPAWAGNFDLLGKLAYKYGLIWGGDWGNPSVQHDFVDSVHVQRCSIKRQKELFAETWYPGSDYNPYKDINIGIANVMGNVAFAIPEFLPPNLAIHLVAHDNYEGDRLTKLENVLQLIENVLNGAEFRDKVLGFKTNGQQTFYYRRSLFGRYVDQPYTNEQVYNMIIEDREEKGNARENIIDLYLELINGADGNVIGYGNPESKEIYTYSVMFDQMTKEDLANHFSHEWCHKLGFGHSFYKSPNRDNSVPYAVGSIVQEIAHKLNAE